MKEKKEKMGKKIYKDNLESIVVSIPYDLMVWVRENGSFSDMVREILDRKTGDEPELNTPLKKQKRHLPPPTICLEVGVFCLIIG